MPRTLPDPMILPKGKKKPAASSCTKADGKIPGRVYVDKNGVEHEWMYEGNPALYLGQNEDED